MCFAECIPRSQRSCLGMLNYLRSVERTLAYDVVAHREEPGKQGSNVEMSKLMSASRGGSGLTGALGSHHDLYSTPADYTVSQTDAKLIV